MTSPHRAREAEIGELLARVEAAAGPDRELDALIAAHVGGWTKGPLDWTDHLGRKRNAPEFYTASIDADLALVERVLGTYSLTLSLDPSGNGAKLTWWPNGLTSGPRFHADEASQAPQLAVLAAMLQVLIESQKPLELRPIHLRLLKRGERGGYIGLADDAAIHTAEVVALGELRRAGLVERAKGPFPPGPPSPDPYVITEAGRRALSTGAHQ